MVAFVPEYIDLRRGQPLPIGGIIDLLKKQSKKTAFVEYYTTPERVFIFVMRSADCEPKVKIVDISYQRLTDYVNRYFHEIVNFPHMLGEKETWQELAEYLIAPIDVVHASCHAYFNPKEPFKSGLLLSDRMLTVKDIFGMNIKSNLLVLSACETGINKRKPGDELIGLTRVFLYSGTKSIMVSLWSVSAVSTLKLMESFYKKIKNEKMSKAEALQKAQIEMMHDARYAHPYYWAPFILIGDWK